jgi:hypothetical protein
MSEPVSEMMARFPVEKWYRDAKLYTIFEGTSEIQRLVIGRALRTDAKCGERPARIAVTIRCSFGPAGKRIVESGPEKRRPRHG